MSHDDTRPSGTPASGSPYEDSSSDASRGTGGYSEIYNDEHARAADEELRRLSNPEMPMIGADRSAGAHQPASGPDGDLRTERDRLASELTARDEHVRSLRQQIAQLEQRLDAARVSAERLDHTQNENRRLEREAEKLRILVEARELEGGEIATRLRSTEADNLSLRQMIDDMKDSQFSFDGERIDLRRQLQQLEAELIRANRDHEGRRSELEVATEDRNELVRSVATLKSERAEDLARVNELEALVERRDNELRHLKKKLVRVESEVERLTQTASAMDVRTAERDKLRRRVDALETELTAQTTEAGASKKALELLASRTSERDQLERQVIDLERSLSDANATTAGSAEAVRMLESRTRERDELEKRLVSIEADLARERAQNVEWRGTADLVTSTTAERDRLRRRVSILESELESIGGSTPMAERPVIPAPAAVPDSANALLVARLEKLEAQLAEAASLPDSPADTLPVETSPVDTSPVADFEALAPAPSDAVAAEPEPVIESTGAFGDLVAGAADSEASLWATAEETNAARDDLLQPEASPFADDEVKETEVRPGVHAMYRQALAGLSADGSEPAHSEAEALASVLFSRTPSNHVPGVETIDGLSTPMHAAEPQTSAMPRPGALPTMPSLESMPAQAMSAPGSAGEAPLPVLAGERAFAPADVRSRRPTEIPRGALLIIDGDGVLNETRYPERFIDAVDLLANDYQAEVQMVFDGTRIQPTPQLGSRDRIQVRFTQGVTVPEVISRMLTAVEGQPNTIVASDNSEVVASVRRARGSAMSTGELIAALVG